MKFHPVTPPRVFGVGAGARIQLKDCARIELDSNDQVTFATPSGAEYDVVRKSWGFYATPSLNGRLQQFGLRGALIKSPEGKYFVWLVEAGKEDEFRRYLDEGRHRLITWMDSDAALESLESRMGLD